MSEKKPAVPQGKASKKSAGERRSGGRVGLLDFAALEFNILNTRYGAHGVVAAPQNGHTRKALALIRRAAAHA